MKTLKLILKKPAAYAPELLTVGNEYELTERWPGFFTLYIDGKEIQANLEDFENPLDIFTKMVTAGNKTVFSGPRQSERVDLLLTENYLIVYSHSKGNHWNICGNHYRYYHSLKTGCFVSEQEAKNEPTIIKQPFLKADYVKLSKLRTA
jgi:hypothetical protein